MGLFIRIGKVTEFLGLLHSGRIRVPGKGNHHRVPVLGRHLLIVDGPPVNPGRGSGLEALHLHPVCDQGIREVGGGFQSIRAGMFNDFSEEAAGIEIGPGAENYGFCVVSCPA